MEEENNPKIYWFVLSYDAPKKTYKKKQVRKEIIKFLLGYGIETMESYTKSTIHFLSSSTETHTYMAEELREKMDFLKFSLSGVSSYLGTKTKPRIEIEVDEKFTKKFEDLVKQVRDES